MRINWNSNFAPHSWQEKVLVRNFAEQRRNDCLNNFTDVLLQIGLEFRVYLSPILIDDFIDGVIDGGIAGFAVELHVELAQFHADAHILDVQVVLSIPLVDVEIDELPNFHVGCFKA